MLLVMAGSAIGGALRFAVGKLLSHCSAQFPFGTLAANLSGCVLLGIFSGIIMKHSPNDGLRLFLVTGLCGGFTTFSTFMNEGFAMLQEARFSAFILYASVSLVAGLACVAAGYAISCRV